MKENWVIFAVIAFVVIAAVVEHYSASLRKRAREEGEQQDAQQQEAAYFVDESAPVMLDENTVEAQFYVLEEMHPAAATPHRREL